MTVFDVEERLHPVLTWKFVHPCIKKSISIKYKRGLLFKYPPKSMAYSPSVKTSGECYLLKCSSIVLGTVLLFELFSLNCGSF